MRVFTYLGGVSSSGSGLLGSNLLLSLLLDGVLGLDRLLGLDLALLGLRTRTAQCHHHVRHA